MSFLFNPITLFDRSNECQNNVKNDNDIQLTLSREVSYQEYKKSDSLIIGYISRKFSAKIKNIGCYIIMIESTEEDGPRGIFCLCKSNSADVGIINTLCKTRGVNGESIDLAWNPQEAISLISNNHFSMNKNFQHRILEFRVRVMIC
jgi:hypothetical protein